MSNKNLIVQCPTCQKSVPWQDKYNYKPFCSQRCRLIDLGEWASEGHTIKGPKMDPETARQLKEFESDV